VTAVDHSAHYTLRTALCEDLRNDLLGPQGGLEEVLATDAPITAYPIGVLFPQAGENTDQPVDDELVDTTPDVVRRDDFEQGVPDLGVMLANRRKPSSMGLTFGADLDITRVVFASVSTATYRPEDQEGQVVEPRRSEARSTEQQKERWRRIPFERERIPVDITWVGMHEPVEVCPGLELRTLVRPGAGNGTVTVTVTLVNTKQVGEYDLQDAYCFFQTKLTMAGTEGTEPFVERTSMSGAVDDEHALSRLLHRYAPIFATGHGCSVAWDWTPPRPRQPMPLRAAVSAVHTEFVPTHEVLLTDSNPDIDNTALGMLALGSGSREHIVDVLSRVLDGYEKWIVDRESEAAELAASEHAAVAKQQMDLCKETLVRMRRGVALLADPDRSDIVEAFRLANMAMADQRARTKWVEDGRKGKPDPAAGRWRPFQIAFMLLCLEGIVDPDHEDRKVADVLWFPTGGGKTEAYLGLVAFTTFLRRLRDGEDGDGVTVLMRYTLRLLTLQQFERAATLICAMERIRLDRPDRLGATPVSIGMWVGKSATPNWLEDADERLKELRATPGKSLATENPVQLEDCPWCGEALSPDDYEVSKTHQRMLVRCPNAECDFNTEAGLPIHLVDEAVYDAHPTLIIATVDKFASMPWRPITGNLYNLDKPGVKPPELIIQDELHLISGPLGTLTGLYETAVDILAGSPKVVASTATIRRAKDQVAALFDREVAQFPPAGLDARDSWFAVETARAGKASRCYVGLLTPSTSQATLLVRTYAALLDAAARRPADEKVRDAYWTLVGYFNSLRLLSAAELQVRGDVQDRLELVAMRNGTKPVRAAMSLVELSSRADSSEIPRRLKHLKLSLPHDDVLDVLLATNMISVGVDINRLGLMAVMGQPQTTAEYIQATSRVGRSHPGLIAVMFNSARSRDRSHYEGFPGFHSALYREVESTSITPFSNRARDRGLHAVIVALTRLTIPAASDNKAAADIENFFDRINEVVRPRIIDRVHSIDDREREATEQHFDEFIDWWRSEAVDNPDLVYEKERGRTSPSLLSWFNESDEQAVGPAGQATLWSLRDVDAESTLFLDNSRRER
jgi:hypothetical protein